jgi:hypothetical protein
VAAGVCDVFCVRAEQSLRGESTDTDLGQSNISEAN